jgi:putative protease
VWVTPADMTGIRPGLEVYRNHDHAFLAQVDAGRPVREIEVRFWLEETPQGLALHARDEDGVAAAAELPGGKVPADKPGRAVTTARRQLARTGGTPFTCAGVELAWERPYFLPVGQLNALRREALERLLAARAEARPRMEGRIQRNEAPYPQRRVDYRGNALNHQAVAFYRRHGVEEVEPAAESGLEMEGRVVMRARYCLKHQLGLCDGDPAGRKDPGWTEPLYLVDEDGHRYRLRFRCAACEMEVIY